MTTSYSYDLFGDLGPPEPAAPVPQPRAYQREAVDKFCLALQQHRSAMALMATGVGKTVCFSWLAEVWPREKGRILVLAHRDELIQQARNMMSLVCQKDVVEVEAGDTFASRRRTSGNYIEGIGPVAKGRIVVASKDTLWRENRLRTFERDEFGLVIVDEAHHCVRRNKTYWNILEYFGAVPEPGPEVTWDCRLAGVTATADRHDKRALGQAFQTVAYEYDILTAVSDGYLVPVVQQYVTVEDYDLSCLRDAKKSGDFGEAELDRLMRREKVLHGIAEAAVKYSCHGGQERPTLIFSASVQHAKDLADILNRRHDKHGSGKAAHVAHEYLTLDERRALVAAFRNHEIRYLCNYGVLCEGFDAPEARVIVIARPTKSRSLYAQIAGRGLRPHWSCTDALNRAPTPEERKKVIRQSVKPGCLIVDPVGVSGLHKLIVSMADILGGFYDDAVVQDAKQAAHDKAAAGGRADVAEELRLARLKREEAERNRKKDLILRAELSSRTVDPFDLLDISPAKEPPMFRGRPATENQKKALVKVYDAKQLEELSFWKAKKTLEQMRKRRESGLCTLPQARLLAKHGYDTNVSMQAATEIIHNLRRNGWRRPDGDQQNGGGH